MILVTGATGNTGSVFLQEYFRTPGQDSIRCLVRPTSDVGALAAYPVETVVGDLENYGTMTRAVAGVDTVVHIAGIRMTEPLLQAAKQAGVKRLICVYTTGVFSQYRDLATEYRRIEEVVRNSGIPYVILRPTMIYGNRKDRNMNRLLRLLSKLPIYPIFGSGNGLMQPVYVGDLGKAVLAAVERPHLVNREYNLPGQAPMPYADIIRTCARALNRKVWLIQVPYWLGLTAARFCELVGLRIIKAEQVLRLQEDKAFTYEAATADLDYAPIHFAEGIALEVTDLRKQGVLSR